MAKRTMAKRTMAKRTIVSPEPVRRSYFNLPWSQVGAEGWAVWAFSVAAIGTAIQLMQLFRGELFRGELFRGKLDLFCHRMPWGMDRWVYPTFAAVGSLAGLASLVPLTLEAGSWGRLLGQAIFVFTAVLCVRQAHPTTNRTTTEIGQRPIGPDHRLSSKSRTRRRISRPDCLLWRSGRRGFFMRTGRPLQQKTPAPISRQADRDGRGGASG
jgi:hypothetical protein